MKTVRLLACACSLALWLAGTTARANDNDAASPDRVVLNQFAAFNRHDADALANGVAEDFVWYNVTSEATTIESSGREKLRDGMKSYFARLPDVTSRADDLAVAGAFVSFRETVTWTGKQGRRSQSSIGIYEVHDRHITRIWYYPATPVGPLPPARPG